MTLVKSYKDIASNLEALKLKEIENQIYLNSRETDILIPKVLPFKGVYTDMLYIRENSILFLKIMDTTEDVFSFLDEEILEIMKEEFETLKKNMEKRYSYIKFNYIFAMPYIDEIEDKYEMDEFIDNQVIVGNKVLEISENSNALDKYLSEKNDEIELSVFIYDICKEYYTLTCGLNLNPFFKKMHFKSKDVDYKVCMMEEEQICQISSINYGNELITGGSGTGKSTLLLARLIKMSKLYPQHKFLLLTFTKQQANKSREILEVLNADMANIEVFTFSSFIFKLAKVNNLVINYDMLKRNYDKSFTNILKQVDNMIKNKRMYKGIFVDEGENFNQDELTLIMEFLYSTKNIFNLSVCRSYNINNNLNIYKDNVELIDLNNTLDLKKNYRQDDKIVDFVNKYCKKANKLIKSLNTNVVYDVFEETEPIQVGNDNVNIVRVEDLDDQISSVVWELEHKINDLGYSYEDIAIVYPYNKKKLKNGKMIYFQYMLRKALEDANIPYTYADDSITSITVKDGVTVSNIYSIKSLSYKVIILCELEMLYNQVLPNGYQEYHVNDFVGDLNKVYTGLTRCEKELSIIVSYTKESSDIIKLLDE